MRVLGCDPSLTDTGWIVLDFNDDGTAEVLDSGRTRTKAKEFFVCRYAKHRENIREVVEKYQPDYVGIEKPPHNASWSAGLYPIWISFAEVCYNHRIPFATWVPPSIKAYARDVLNDKGKMFKSDMVDAAKELLGDSHEGKLNHNIADAVVIAWISWRLQRLILEEITEDDLTDKERYLLTRTVTRRKTGRVDKLGMIYKEGEMYYDLRDPKYDIIYEQENT